MNKIVLTQTVWMAGSLCFFPAWVAAHALNPESIDRYAEITLTPRHVVLIYELVLGINPTERAIQDLDRDQDGTISEEERTQFVQKAAQRYAKKQSVRIGNQALLLQYVQGDAYKTLGHNLINVIKIDLGYVGEIPSSLPRGATLSFHYEDNNVKTIAGWKQVNFIAQGGVHYQGHIPYKELKKFDYAVMQEKGYTPATESLQLDVSLPATSSDAPSAPAIILPPKVKLETPPQQGANILSVIWAALGMVLVGGGIILWKVQKTQKNLRNL